MSFGAATEGAQLRFCYASSMIRRIRMLAGTLLCGLAMACGPVAVGAGLGDLFKSDSAKDLSPPGVTIQAIVRQQPGLARTVGDAPRFVSFKLTGFNQAFNLVAEPLIFVLTPRKSGQRMGVFLVPADDIPVIETVCDEAGRFVRPDGTVELQIDANPDPDTTLPTVTIDTLDDGDYIFVAAGTDGNGKPFCSEHRFTVDKTDPVERPILQRVEARAPRSISLEWTPSGDADVVGYHIHFDVGTASIPSTKVRTRNQTYDGTPNAEVPDSPIFVAGRETTRFEMTHLLAARLYILQVVAVDAAGNESELDPFGSEIVERSIRTRAGGDGTFTSTPIEIRPEELEGGQVASSPDELRVADVNEDGDADIIAFWTVMPFVLLGTGGHDAVTFRGEASEPPGDGGYIRGQALGDINGDSRLDYVQIRDHEYYLPGASSILSVYTGDEGVTPTKGSGKFSLLGTIVVQPFLPGGDPNALEYAQAVRIRDLDQDGKPDLLWSTFADFSVRWHRDVLSPEGSTPLRQDVPAVIDFFGGGNLFIDSDKPTFAVADFDGDGRLDLIASNGGESIFARRGPFTATTETPFYDAPLFSSSISGGTGRVAGILADDVDGDGRPDLVLSLDSGAVSVRLNRGPVFPVPGDPAQVVLDFTPPVVVPVSETAAGAPAIATGDFNGDGLLDIAAGPPFDHRVAIVLASRQSDGSVTFKVKGYLVPSDAMAVNNFATSLATGDMNGDGITDVIVGGSAASSGTGRIWIYPGRGAVGRGNGGLQHIASLGTVLGAKSELRVVGSARINDDDLLDIVTVARKAPRQLLVLNQARLLESSVTGSFEFGASSLWSTPPGEFLVGDFSGEGKGDVVGVSENSFDTQVSKGDVFARFTTTITAPAGSGPTSRVRPPAAGDFNGDGKLDLLFVGAQGAVVFIPGSGSAIPFPATFSTATELVAGFSTDAVAVGDIDRDGHLDFAALDATAGTVKIRLGDGRGGFASPESDPAYKMGVELTGPALEFTSIAAPPARLILADVDYDGVLDLVALNPASGKIAVNFGGPFGEPTSIATGTFTNPVDLAVGDVNGDRLLDLIVGNLDAPRILMIVQSAATSRTFASPVEYVERGELRSMTAADFDADGILDVVGESSEGLEVIGGTGVIVPDEAPSGG